MISIKVGQPGGTVHYEKFIPCFPYMDIFIWIEYLHDYKKKIAFVIGSFDQSVYLSVHYANFSLNCWIKPNNVISIKVGQPGGTVHYENFIPCFPYMDIFIRIEYPHDFKKNSICYRLLRSVCLSVCLLC